MADSLRVAVLGMAHDGQDLPPTLVRNIAALSAPQV